MKFLFTMNMPPGSPKKKRGDDYFDDEYERKVIHQVTGDHPSESLYDLMETMNNDPFIIVDEWYKKFNQDSQRFESYIKGQVILNTQMIGKVKEYTEYGE